MKGGSVYNRYYNLKPKCDMYPAKSPSVSCKLVKIKEYLLKYWPAYLILFEEKYGAIEDMGGVNDDIPGEWREYGLLNVTKARLHLNNEAKKKKIKDYLTDQRPEYLKLFEETHPPIEDCAIDSLPDEWKDETGKLQVPLAIKHINSVDD